MDKSEMKQLEAAVDGRVIGPDSDDYDEARSVWNGMVDRRPELIMQCRGPDDVVAAIHFAREAGLPITARGGGHGVTGHAIAEEGLVDDLRLMNNVSVDAEATAFPHRDTEFNMGIWAGWTDPARDDEIIAWTRKLNDAMSPHSTGGMYLNYIDRDDQDKLTETFGENHARLQAVKEKYDPHNRFRPS